MKRILIILAVIALALLFPLRALAATTADVTVTWTPEYIAIEVDDDTWAAGTQAASATPSTAINAHTIDNTSTVSTDISIGVTGDWTGGGGSSHADDGNPGANTVGMYAGVDDADDLFDVIVKKTPALNNIIADLAATTDFSFGLKLYIPTSFIDGTMRTNTVRLTATKH